MRNRVFITLVLQLIAHHGDYEGTSVMEYVMNISPNAYQQGYRACEFRMVQWDDEKSVTFG